MITFGSGEANFSNATSSSFNFSTSYLQEFLSPIHDGKFAFVNAVPPQNDVWHVGALDHTPDDPNGYMFLVNVAFIGGVFFNATVQNLCVGEHYELSIYAANILKSNDSIKPNLHFEIRTTTDDILLASLNTGQMNESDPMTWIKYGVSFQAMRSSIVLLMISAASGGHGNDLVIDDIALRICSTNRTLGVCTDFRG